MSLSYNHIVLDMILNLMTFFHFKQIINRTENEAAKADDSYVSAVDHVVVLAEVKTSWRRTRTGVTLMSSVMMLTHHSLV